ncbi:MAG: hypothetical protein EOM20_03660 [Spartobacteria bacterium]|nr:hypothetical protein [Spartobacteria bacterium]
MFVKEMLKEELENSLRIKADYEAALGALPAGALVRKMIGGRPYYYLAVRRGSKVCYDYLGKISDAEVLRYEEAKKQRAVYRKQLSELKKQIRFLERVSRG